jgi:hypothetical protein
MTTTNQPADADDRNAPQPSRAALALARMDQALAALRAQPTLAAAAQPDGVSNEEGGYRQDSAPIADRRNAQEADI